MEYFDELTKKTKEIIDVVKLNTCIVSEEKEMEEYYSELGRLFYNSKKASDDEVYQEVYSEIEACNKRIDEFKELIKTKKGIVFCQGCNGENPIEAIFCNKCGLRIKDE